MAQSTTTLWRRGPADPRRHPPASAKGSIGSNLSTIPEAISRDLPIGSGLIESGHKHVLQARLKKAGSAWLPANADALAQLRVLRANQQWDAYWEDQRAA